MNYNSGLILLLFIIWSLFFAWQIEMKTIIEEYPDTIVRIDLLILPFLIVLTVYILYIVLRKQKQ